MRELLTRKWSMSELAFLLSQIKVWVIVSVGSHLCKLADEINLLKTSHWVMPFITDHHQYSATRSMAITLPKTLHHCIVLRMKWTLSMKHFNSCQGTSLAATARPQGWHTVLLTRLTPTLPPNIKPLSVFTMCTAEHMKTVLLNLNTSPSGIVSHACTAWTPH